MMEKCADEEEEMENRAEARIVSQLRLAEPPPRSKAEIIPWPKTLSDIELVRRQAIIDATWERVVAERERMEADACRTCHVGRNDPDFWMR